MTNWATCKSSADISSLASCTPRRTFKSPEYQPSAARSAQRCSVIRFESSASCWMTKWPSWSLYSGPRSNSKGIFSHGQLQGDLAGEDEMVAPERHRVGLPRPLARPDEVHAAGHRLSRPVVDDDEVKPPAARTTPADGPASMHGGANRERRRAANGAKFFRPGHVPTIWVAGCHAHACVACCGVLGT